MGASTIKKGRKVLLGRKVGMTQVFEEDGTLLPVTVLEVGPCTVLQVKDPKVDGYSSLQVGFLNAPKQPKKPRQGIFNKAKSAAQRLVREIPSVDPADIFRGPLLSEVGGVVEYENLEEGKNLHESKVLRNSMVSRIVVDANYHDTDAEKADSKKNGGADNNSGAEKESAAPDGDGASGDGASGEGESQDDSSSSNAPEAKLLIKDSSGKVLKEYALSLGSSIEVKEGATVADGDLLAYVPLEGPPEKIEVGFQLGVGIFKETSKVDIRGLTKGRGFQGNIKRHGMSSGDKSHGGKNVRQPGSTGMCANPSRLFKNRKMPGQMGAEWRKIKNLRVVEVDQAANLMLVKGAVPGPPGGYLLVQESLSSGKVTQSSGKVTMK